MASMISKSRLFGAVILGLLSGGVAAQGRTLSANDYAQAERFMTYNTTPLVDHAVQKVSWLDDGHFWYRDHDSNGDHFVQMDAASGKVTPLFDQVKRADALGKATSKPVSFPSLDAVKDVLVGNPKVTLEVQGHTDNVGAAALNLKLSQQRADSVKAYLVKAGIPESRLVAKGYGMNQPLVPNDSVTNKALNRRVQFIRTEAANP